MRIVREYLRPISADPAWIDVLREQLSGSVPKFWVIPNHNVPAPSKESPAKPSAGSPVWSELIFDLAWTATFSALSSNTTVADGMVLISYIVFFAIVWFMWVTQILCDSVTSPRDPFRYLRLTYQLPSFAVLIAFTGVFDISVGFKDKPTSAQDSWDASYAMRAPTAISCMLFIRTIFLWMQYPDDQTAKVPGTADTSHFATSTYMTRFLPYPAMLYLAAFILGCVARVPTRVSTGIAYGVWVLAMGLEAFSHIRLFNAGNFDRDMVMERLSALTIIVIGEGINSFIGPLTSGGRAVAFHSSAVAPMLGAVLTPLVLLMLYSQSATWWRLIPPRRTVLAVFSYFWLQLCIILLFLSLKFVLMNTQIQIVLDEAHKVVDRKNLSALPSDAVRVFSRLGMDLRVLVDRLLPICAESTTNYWDTIQNTTSGGAYMADVTDTQLQIRLYGAIQQAALDMFNIFDSETSLSLYDYIYSVNSSAVQDTIQYYTHPFSRIGSYQDPQRTGWEIDNILASSLTSERFAPAVAVTTSGLFLLLLCWMNDLAGVRNRLALRSLFVRVAISVFLAIIAQYPGILYTALPLILWFMFLAACLLDGRFASKALRELEGNPHLAAHPHPTLSESSGTAMSSSAARPTMHSSATMPEATGPSSPPQQHVFATQPPTGHDGSDANGFVILRHQGR